MALNRLGNSLSGYNAYNIPPASDRSAQIAPAKEAQDTSVGLGEPKQQEKKMDLTVEVPKRDNASIENVAISLGVYDGISVDLFGRDGIASNDMKQAISGMKKDHILHEYQYFVGNKDMTGKAANVISGTEDGLVIKLN
ncbi:MAG: hypothetical protein IJJ65_08870 [Butyrivibrio sp.]|nr:hypothetical protein [Butyrivibrio sp.]